MKKFCFGLVGLVALLLAIGQCYAEIPELKPQHSPSFFKERPKLRAQVELQFSSSSDLNRKSTAYMLHGLSIKNYEN